jgi:ParB/RepB/Spo0J family partition protein
MKIQNVPLDQIVWNPWRDKAIFPLDPDKVKDLKESIDDHDFFQSVKGRRHDGKVQLGCGHSRFEAAKKAKLETVPIFVAPMDDDQMLRLMVDENALQSGANPGAILNEIAAVTKRLAESLLTDGAIPAPVSKAFGSIAAIEKARTALRSGRNAHMVLNANTIRAYLGQGDPERAHRPERALREAIGALRQSGKFEDIIDEALLKHPEPVTDTPATGRTVARTQERGPRIRVLDDRCASAFPSDHQFHAFREAVTSEGAKRVIPVNQQYELAKSIMTLSPEARSAISGATNKKQIGAPFIKMKVQAAVEEGLKKQREIDKEEREAYLSAQREARIDAELHSANASLRSLLSAMKRMGDLAEKFPAHPKIRGFSARLDTLVSAIQQFSEKLR